MMTAFTLLMFAWGACAETTATGPATLPAGWSYHDLAREPVLALALGGARATMTYVDPAGQTLATVRVYRSQVLKAPWPDRVATWTDRLVGHERVMKTKAARLVKDKKDGARRYLVETISDADDGEALHTTLLAIEYRHEGRLRLQIFSFEDTRDAHRVGAPAVNALFKTLESFPL